MDKRFFEIIFKRQNFTDDDIDVLIEMLESQRNCNRATQMLLNYCRGSGVTHDAWGFITHDEESLTALTDTLEVDWDYIEEHLNDE